MASTPVLGQPLRSRSPVGRSTVARDQDTVDALQVAGRWEEAARWCEDVLRECDPQSDARAWWTIKRAQVATARHLVDGGLNDQDYESLVAPIDQILQSYGDHPREAFLRAGKIHLLFDAAADDVVRSVIAYGNETLVDRALKRLLRCDQQAAAISRVIDEEIVTRRRRRSGDDVDQRASNEAVLADLERLQQELVLLQLQTAVLRSELFPPRSQDFVAAAAKAVQVGQQTIERLPSTSNAGREAELMMIDALIRAGRDQDAASRLQRFAAKVNPGNATERARLMALAIQLDLSRDRIDSAGRNLRRSEIQSASLTEPSLPLDLIRLRWMIAVTAPKEGSANDGPTTTAIEVGQDDVPAWIDQIGERHGAYAKRRAEAILLSSLSTSDHRGGDRAAAVLAIRGRQQLRDGLWEQAAATLARAAEQESDPENAIESALQAAAALQKRNRTADAADLMARVSSRHPGDERAAQVHLQAAVMRARSARPWSTSTLLDHLRTQVRLWPSANVTAAAKQWAAATLLDDERPIEAGEVIAWNDTSHWTAGEVTSATTLWIEAAMGGDDQALGRFTKLVQRSIAENRLTPDAAVQLAVGATFLLDIDDLRQVESFVQSQTPRMPAFSADLLAFRIEQPPPPPTSQPGDRKDWATWRLTRDAKQNRTRRQTTIALLDSWQAGQPIDRFSAQRLIWQGKGQQAADQYRQLANESSDPSAVLREGAATLGESKSADDRQLAINLWDELASRQPLGSAAWHDAKLRAAELLFGMGQRDEAEKRIRYVLLTNPPKREPLRQRYDRLLRQNGLKP